MGNTESPGVEPVTLVQVDPDGDPSFGMYKFNDEVKDVLKSEDFGNAKLAVIAITGELREGKSFFMSFLLQYARMKYKMGHADDGNWLGNNNEKINGFPFKYSTKKQTTGIVIWPELFQLIKNDGERIVLVFIDTQGTHDSETASTVSAGIVAISIVISSLLIFNVMREVNDENLQNLEVYTGYARHALQGKAFHDGHGPNLLLLVRDFKLGNRFGMGMAGGNMYLQETLLDATDFHEQYKTTCDNVISSFDKIICALLPEPGRIAIEGKDFAGELKDVDERFKKAMAAFVPAILNTDHLTLKTIGGVPITVTQFFNLVEETVLAFNETKLPQLTTILGVSAANDHYRAMEVAYEWYIAKMEATGCAGSSYVKLDTIDDTHLSAKARALDLFEEMPKIGQGYPTTPYYARKLKALMEKKYDEYINQNTAKMVCLSSSVGPALFFFFGLYFIYLVRHASITSTLGGEIILSFYELVFFLLLIKWMWGLFLRYVTTAPWGFTRGTRRYVSQR